MLTIHLDCRGEISCLILLAGITQQHRGLIFVRNHRGNVIFNEESWREGQALALRLCNIYSMLAPILDLNFAICRSTRLHCRQFTPRVENICKTISCQAARPGTPVSDPATVSAVASSTRILPRIPFRIWASRSIQRTVKCEMGWKLVVHYEGPGI